MSRTLGRMTKPSTRVQKYALKKALGPIASTSGVKRATQVRREIQRNDTFPVGDGCMMSAQPSNTFQ